MTGEALDENAAQRAYWNTVAGPRWFATPADRGGGLADRHLDDLGLGHLGYAAGHATRQLDAAMSRAISSETVVDILPQFGVSVSPRVVRSDKALRSK
jgi:hypothetical protein